MTVTLFKFVPCPDSPAEGIQHENAVVVDCWQFQRYWETESEVVMDAILAEARVNEISYNPHSQYEEDRLRSIHFCAFTGAEGAKRYVGTYEIILTY